MTTQDHAGIGTPETLPITQLNTFHKNARRGDVDAIAGSLAANGQFRPIVVNKGTHTGRPYEVLAGNHTLLATRQLAETHPDDPRWHHIDTWIVDVDDERATKIVLADNRTADLGTYDDEALLDLLETVDHDLDGTGYDYDDLIYLAEDHHDDSPAEGNDTHPGDSTTPTTDEEYQEEIERLHDKYTHAAKAPIYEPQEDEAPPLEELIDTTKTDQLIHLIDNAEGVPNDVKKLLRATAQRHTVINFKKIAEWYAHQPGDIQELTEQQALVIIDLDSALQHGFARLTGELRRHALNESGYDDAHPDPAHRNPHIELTPEDEEIREKARARSTTRTPVEATQ